MEISSWGKLFFIIVPLVIAGVSNMIFVKLPVLNNLKVPMDKGKLLKDGRRLFGDNKTWKGFFGMILVTAFWIEIWGLLISNFDWAANLSIMNITAANGWFYGAIWGLAYVLFELPNSFLKRRLDISAGKKGKGALGLFFQVLDQADSVIGILIVMYFLNGLGLADALVILVLATVIHLLVNIILYFTKLKKDI